MITDIVMPVKPGIEVLMELRKVKPPVKIIAISGGGRQSATDYLPLAELMGATVLAKPFPTRMLIAAVNELLQREHASAEPPAPE